MDQLTDVKQTKNQNAPNPEVQFEMTDNHRHLPVRKLNRDVEECSCGARRILIPGAVKSDWIEGEYVLKERLENDEL